VRVVWKSFILRDEDPTAAFNDYRRAHWARAGAYEPESVFVPWRGDARFPTWGVPSLVAAKAAARQGRFDAFHMACFKAMFTDSRDISDPAVLVEIAREVGCDPVRFAADLGDRSLAEEVLAEHREGVRAFGIQAIPTVVVGGRVIQGAVPEEEYARAVEAARRGGGAAGGAGATVDAGPADRRGDGEDGEGGAA
jgi:predicted DsbA family dithiol-disulfide isomerase